MLYYWEEIYEYIIHMFNNKIYTFKKEKEYLLLTLKFDLFDKKIRNWKKIINEIYG